MRLGSALVLSCALIYLSQPAAAAPDKKQAHDRNGAVAAKKQAMIKPGQAVKPGVAIKTPTTAAVMTAPKGKPGVAAAVASKQAATGKRDTAKSAAMPQSKQAVAGRQDPAKSTSVVASKQAAAGRQEPAKSTSVVASKQAANPDTAKSTAKKAEVARHSRGVSALASVPRQTRIQVASIETTGSVSAPSFRVPHLFASPDPVLEARRWIGTNPTDRSNLWCARFMNFVLERSGFKGTGSDAAKSFASYGHRVSGPRVGAIAVMTRGKYGGHVGIVSGIDEHGNPIVISGNNYGRKVGESTYPRSRIYAYVMPQR
jgi:uncharacterized protein (TIGR02594 family)